MARSVLFTPVIGISTTSSGGSQTHVLNTAYSFGTAANQACAIRFVSPVTSTLTHAYFFVSASNGSVGNCLCEVRNYSSTTVPAGGAALASENASWVGAVKWMQVAFSSPASVTRGTAYYVVLGNADATPGTNYPTIRTSFSGPAPTDSMLGRFRAATSTNGFSTGTLSTSGYSPVCVLKFADGTIIGSPYTASGNYTSNTRRRGMKVNNLDKPLGITTAVWNVVSGTVTSLETYSGTTIPGGTLVRTADTISASASALGASGMPELILSANTVYRLILTYSTSGQTPGFWQIEDSASFADILSAGIAGGKIHSTISDGGSPEAWIDETDKLPRMLFEVSQYGETSSGGAIGGGNLSGGFQ